MVAHLSNKIIKFLKKSYPSKIRKVLFVIFILGLATTWLITSLQYSTIDQRISEQKAQIEIEKSLYSQFQLQFLNDLKSKIESGFYYLIVSLFFLVIVVVIPLIRLLFIACKLLWSGGRTATTTLRLESVKMSSFQKYLLVISALILLAIVVVIFILLT